MKILKICFKVLEIMLSDTFIGRLVYLLICPCTNNDNDDSILNMYQFVYDTQTRPTEFDFQES